MINVEGNKVFNEKRTERVYLENLEVLDVLVLQVGLELDLFEEHRPGKEHVHELAVGGTWMEKQHGRLKLGTSNLKEVKIIFHPEKMLLKLKKTGPDLKILFLA